MNWYWYLCMDSFPYFYNNENNRNNDNFQNNIVDFLLPGKNLLLHSAVVDQVASSRCLQCFCQSNLIPIFLSSSINICLKPNKYFIQTEYLCGLCGWIGPLLEMVFWGEKNLFRLLIYSLSLGSGWYLKKGGDQIKESTLRLLYVSKYHHHHHRHPFQDVWFITCWTSGCHWPCGTAVWHGTTLQSRMGKVGTLFKELGWGKWELDVFLYQTTRRKTRASSSGKVGSLCTKLAFEHNTKTI